LSIERDLCLRHIPHHAFDPQRLETLQIVVNLLWGAAQGLPGGITGRCGNREKAV